ncbi:MAG: T9SS type A sorting domain-containing protein [Taibaiella sp.]|nr:T9SS type A sorting domain-containing protein [Taibaiella sp.]
MKRTLLLFSALGLLYVTMSGYSTGPSGTPQGVMTAKQGCSGSGCHGGPITDTALKLKLVQDGHTDPIPAFGKYSPNAKYTVTVTFNRPGAAKYGYIVLATYGVNNQAGMFANPNSNPGVKITSKPPHTVVEQPSPITPGPNGMEAIFEWTAPAKGTGSVTFSVAANGTNGNGAADTGDRYAYKFITFQEGFPVSVNDVAREIDVMAYPNPTDAILNVDIRNNVPGQYYYRVYSSSGVLVIEGHLQTSVNRLDISAMSGGVYFMSITNGSEQKVITFNKL